MKFILPRQLLLTPCDLISLKNRMAIEQIKSRLNLLNKLISALREAEESGIKDPAKLMKKALKARTNFKVDKSRHKKSAD